MGVAVVVFSVGQGIAYGIGWVGAAIVALIAAAVVGAVAVGWARFGAKYRS